MKISENSNNKKSKQIRIAKCLKEQLDKKRKIEISENSNNKRKFFKEKPL